MTNKADELEIRHLPLKRIFDIVFSIIVIMFLFPFFLLIALIIRATSPGPAIYYQNRIGRGGKHFKCYKFRTMLPDADARLDEILASHPDIKREWDTNHKLKNDPRITSIGRFLRQTSLDELPQFWNVLKGDLSVVGPRPVVEEELTKHFGDKANIILTIRPGITGIWQVSGRSDTTYAKRIALDEHYIKTRSLLLDCKIIVITIYTLFSKNGAY